jgi:hypothetical protein
VGRGTKFDLVCGLDIAGCVVVDCEGRDEFLLVCGFDTADCVVVDW